ncbi:MAG: LCP family protein [Chloroflexota bacterium]|nr:LCP family protein [Chloroflexota bacterium]
MRKKTGRAFLIGLISIVSVIIVGALIAWNTPIFGTRLPKPNSLFNPDALEKSGVGLSEEINNLEGGDPPESGVAEEDNEDLQAEAQPDEETTDENQTPVCNGPESMNVLLLVIDKNAQADAIRLVHIDFIDSKVSVLSIPRDFYVPIADMAEYGITWGRINATYGYGEKFHGKGQGIDSLVTNLNYNFGVTFDHYLVLYFSEIAKYIDEIGGIDIYLDTPVEDGSSYFGSGDHHLDGETAVIFMRMRYYDDDFARVRRQTLVLRAFYEKMMNELTWMEQTQMGVHLLKDKNIQTDFAPKDLYPLACLSRAIETNDVDFVEIPNGMYRPATTEQGGAVQIPYDTVVPFIQSVMDGSYEP